MDDRSPLSSVSGTGSVTAPTATQTTTAANTTVATSTGPPKDKHRVSRACVSCRQRKTRCDLYSHGTPGDPPCTRCFQERLECTLATSRRGGRRPRRTDVSQGQGQGQGGKGQSHGLSLTQGQGSGSSSLPPSSPQPGTPSSTRRASVRMTGTDIDGDFASRDLLNPSDALNLLAQVADLDGDHDDEHGQNHEQGHSSGNGHRNDAQSGTPTSHHHNDPNNNTSHQNTPFYYPPISDGHLSLADASYLLQHYHEHYHPFFPVADKRVFDGRGIASLAQAEPHLLTSIFTVASKDDPAWHRVHEACASHMDSLVSRLISRGSPSVGAVEALLILAEWAPQRPQPTPHNDSQQQQHLQPHQQTHKHAADAAPTLIGRGEEDQGAWMQIGVAIRLAYLQGLEQTGLLLNNVNKPADFERKRIAWAACYMSDREVSIRLGKGFWSRGPGPSTVLNAGDFPTLRTQRAGAGDLAQLFQARLEMTQLFSNAHDVLYSSTTHREQLFVGGEYVRYIDDFTAVLRKWKLVWGGLSLTPSVKAALILSYEFLRLYINAFAFQATISRAITRARQSPPPSRSAVRPLFADLAGAPDARFIYESIDAANTLLSTLNDFIDPATTLRHMPLKYYLYVIYAAVFLFKARVAGALAGESGSSARRTINVTIDRLQKSSVNPHGLGQRYARSLYLLWRKSVDRAVAQKSKTAEKEKAAEKAAATAATTAAATAANTPMARGQSSSDQNSSGPQSPDASAINANSNMNSTGGNNSGNLDTSSMVTGTTVAVDTTMVNGGDVPHNNPNHTGDMGSGPGGYGRPAPPEMLDPLKGFSWRDLDGLGQFIGNDMNFLDITFATPMSDSDHGAAGMDTMTDAWQDILWSGNDVIF